VSPPTDAFDIEVYPNRQPVLRRGVGKDLYAINALHALEWSVLPLYDGVDVRYGGLTNYLELQVHGEPRRSL
jgi:hypothetical protein